jgi:hypothetical protein
LPNLPHAQARKLYRKRFFNYGWPAPDDVTFLNDPDPKTLIALRQNWDLSPNGNPILDPKTVFLICYRSMYVNKGPGKK